MKSPAIALLVALGFALGLATGMNLKNRQVSEPVAPIAVASPTQPPTASSSSVKEPPPIAQPSPAESSLDTRVEVARETPPTQPPAQAIGSGSITVTVVDSLGTPLADATVRKRAERGERVVVPLELDDLRGGSRLLTDAAGQVRLESVPLGEYRVYAERNGLAPGLSELVSVSTEASDVRATVTLTTGGTVTGELRDVNGQPAAAIGLSIHPGRLRSSPSPVALRQVNTDRNGAFAFEHLPAGPWELYTRADGADLLRVPEQHYSVEVVEGQTTRVAFKDLSGTAVRVSGQVLRNGEAMPKARVMVSPVEPIAKSVTQSSADTDVEGRFQILLQEPGEYRFSVAQPKEESSTRIVSFKETVPALAQHEVILAFETGSLSGRVTLATGEPAQGAEVRVLAAKGEDPRRASGGGSVSTNVEGRYSFTGLPAGRYRLNASAASKKQIYFDGSGSTGDIQLEPGAALENVDIQLSEGGAVEGRVLRADGKPAAGARMELRGRESLGGSAADAQGNFVLSGLRPGPVSLRAISDRECSAWMAVQIVANATTKSDLVIAPGTLLLVEVEDANGPAAQAAVTLSSGSELDAQAVIISDGKGRVGPIAPGTYTVTLRREWRDKNAPKWESSITLNGEAERLLQLRLP